jgi:murein DD-endopeptidase
MLSNDVSVVKYSVLGSAMLTLTGCGLNPKVADSLPLQTIQPDKAKLAQVDPLPAKPRTTTLKPPSAPSLVQSVATSAVTSLDKVVVCALKQCGKGYCWGGNTPMKGFDCSGLTQYSFGQGASVKIPRTAAAQYQVAYKVPLEDAARGDLIFFKTRGQRVSHVGIYLGADKFVHAPRTGKPIMVSKLDGYWKRRLVGFGRIPGAARPLLPNSVV